MLKVAVTGPTGEIGKPFVDRLERIDEVGEILAMARSPFDPAGHGWTKTTYRQGDILDRASVDELVAGADVVVHLAFIVLAASGQSHEVNVAGSRNVFEAAAAAGAKRLVYTSSVAAYGYSHADQPLSEDTPTHGTDAHAYSRQKAEVEGVLSTALEGSSTEAYVFRPCIVAGPQSQALIEAMPYVQLEDKVPATMLEALGRLPWVAPLLPDHGIDIQLVHHDDVADALIAAVRGAGAPGVYNLAAEGTITISDIADALGWHSIRIPREAVELTADITGRIGPLEVVSGWLQAMRTSMLMDTSRAREELDWQPAHDAAETLAAMVAARSD